MRWPAVCDNISPVADECALLEDVAKQCSEDCD
jgi:hypothetical protein